MFFHCSFVPGNQVTSGSLRGSAYLKESLNPILFVRIQTFDYHWIPVIFLRNLRATVP